EDGIRALIVTGVQTCALPISRTPRLSGSTTVDYSPNPVAHAELDAQARDRRSVSWITPQNGAGLARLPHRGAHAADRDIRPQYRSEERRVGKEGSAGWARVYG